MKTIKKTCSKCQEDLLLKHFYKQPNGKHGCTAECKSCRLVRQKKWSRENPEKLQLSRRKGYDSAKAAIKNRKWREENPDYMIEYRAKNK